MILREKILHKFLSLLELTGIRWIFSTYLDEIFLKIFKFQIIYTVDYQKNIVNSELLMLIASSDS